jgi:hypothetical protein
VRLFPHYYCTVLYQKSLQRVVWLFQATLNANIGCRFPTSRSHMHDSSRCPGRYPLSLDRDGQNGIVDGSRVRAPASEDRLTVAERALKPARQAAQLPLGVTVSASSKGIGRVRRRFARSECTCRRLITVPALSCTFATSNNFLYMHLAQHRYSLPQPQSPAPRANCKKCPLFCREDLRRARRTVSTLVCWAWSNIGIWVSPLTATVVYPVCTLHVAPQAERWELLIAC